MIGAGILTWIAIVSASPYDTRLAMLRLITGEGPSDDLVSLISSFLPLPVAGDLPPLTFADVNELGIFLPNERLTTHASILYSSGSLDHDVTKAKMVFDQPRSIPESFSMTDQSFMQTIVLQAMGGEHCAPVIMKGLSQTDGFEG